MKKVLSRFWFSRTWVRQEVFAARILDLQIGSHTIAFSQFLLFADKTQTTTSQLRSLRASYKGKDHGGHLDTRDESNAPETLTYQTFRGLCDNLHFEAMDARDGVYALVG